MSYMRSRQMPNTGNERRDSTEKLGFTPNKSHGLHKLAKEKENNAPLFLLQRYKPFPSIFRSPILSTINQNLSSLFFFLLPPFFSPRKSHQPFSSPLRSLDNQKHKLRLSPLFVSFFRQPFLLNMKRKKTVLLPSWIPENGQPLLH